MTVEFWWHDNEISEDDDDDDDDDDNQLTNVKHFIASLSFFKAFKQ